jgi:glycosyltransferase involved in cell wall biosynthesis
MNNPLVSISCVTFNHAPFIRECLDSLLMQNTNFQFEIIIHDDASTDGTREIIEEYTAKYPEIIFPLLQTENQYSKGLRGMMARFNFPRCNGEFIAICEGDDFWTDENKLQKQVDFLKQKTDYSMCFHNANRIFEIEDINKSYNIVENKDYLINELFLRWIAPTSSLLFKKEVVSKITDAALDKRILNGDLIIVLSCFDFGKVKGFSDYMSSYRVHSNGVSQSRIKEDNLKHLLNYIPYYMLIREKFPKINNTVFNIKLVDNYLALTMFYLKRKNILFFKYLMLALYYNPKLLIKVFLKPFKRT